MERENSRSIGVLAGLKTAGEGDELVAMRGRKT